MVIDAFSIARLPRIEFGAGSINKVAAICRSFGISVLLVTGGSSFLKTLHFTRLRDALEAQGCHLDVVNIPGEPSPQMVDQAVRDFRYKNIDVVLGIGGGSPLDAAKAIAGLLRVGNSVMDYLEGVGPELPYQGPAVPFIAIPTTAGTGSEATKNAVLSVQGKAGFKKSFRHDMLVAEYAIVDPELLASCPPGIIAANGMDALTQLMEAYVSLRANRMTDALVVSGLRAIRHALVPLYQNQGDGTQARVRMAYASLMSGICLAQTGLGSVHGLASPLGAFFPIPHGVVCGTLVADATDMNIHAMLERDHANPALDKYVRLAEILNQKRYHNKHEAWEALRDLLYDWTEKLQLKKLSAFGVTEDDLEHIVANARGSSMQTNPIVMTDAELKELLLRRL